MRGDAGVCIRWGSRMRVAAAVNLPRQAAVNLPRQAALSPSQQNVPHLADPLEDESTMRSEVGWQETPRKSLSDLRGDYERAVSESRQASGPPERLLFEKRHVSSASASVAKCACDSEREIKGIAARVD